MTNSWLGSGQRTAALEPTLEVQRFLAHGEKSEKTPLDFAHANSVAFPPHKVSLVVLFCRLFLEMLLKSFEGSWQERLQCPTLPNTCSWSGVENHRSNYTATFLSFTKITRGF